MGVVSLTKNNSIWLMSWSVTFKLDLLILKIKKNILLIIWLIPSVQW